MTVTFKNCYRFSNLSYMTTILKDNRHHICPSFTHLQ